MVEFLKIAALIYFSVFFATALWIVRAYRFELVSAARRVVAAVLNEVNRVLAIFVK